MALNWRWDKKVGEATFRNSAGKTYKTSLYIGNAFLISLYRYKENGEKMYTMHGFFCDETHAKRCLGLVAYDGYKENNYKGRLVAVTLYRDMFTEKHLGKLVAMLSTADFDELKLTIKATGKRTKKEVTDNG